MRRPPPGSPGTPAGLPPKVQLLLLDVVADGFVLYCCGPRSAPRALVASYEWDSCVDLLTIRSFETVIAARVPKSGRVDVFAPDCVVWAYQGPPQWTLRALLTLVHPRHPDAPTTAYPAPAALLVPREQQRPMTIRPPAAGQAQVRATRLAGSLPR